MSVTYHQIGTVAQVRKLIDAGLLYYKGPMYAPTKAGIAVLEAQNASYVKEILFEKSPEGLAKRRRTYGY